MVVEGLAREPWSTGVGFGAGKSWSTGGLGAGNVGRGGLRAGSSMVGWPESS